MQSTQKAPSHVRRRNHTLGERGSNKVRDAGRQYPSHRQKRPLAEKYSPQSTKFTRKSCTQAKTLAQVNLETVFFPPCRDSDGLLLSTLRRKTPGNVQRCNLALGESLSQERNPQKRLRIEFKASRGRKAPGRAFRLVEPLRMRFEGLYFFFACVISSIRAFWIASTTYPLSRIPGAYTEDTFFATRAVLVKIYIPMFHITSFLSEAVKLLRSIYQSRQVINAYVIELCYCNRNTKWHFLFASFIPRVCGGI